MAVTRRWVGVKLIFYGAWTAGSVTRPLDCISASLASAMPEGLARSHPQSLPKRPGRIKVRSSLCHLLLLIRLCDPFRSTQSTELGGWSRLPCLDSRVSIPFSLPSVLTESIAGTLHGPSPLSTRAELCITSARPHILRETSDKCEFLIKDIADCTHRRCGRETGS
jgi:hypothetical protein